MQVVTVDSEGAIVVGGLPAYEIIGRVRNEKGIELKRVAWMVFGRNQTLMLDATSRPEQFDLVWPQVLAIRNGVRLK
jgi:hypothetical protein